MGSTFRFVHCADLHLGGRFKGVSAADPALGKEMRESLFGSFGRIVDLVRSEKADALVISGDVYDDGNYLPSTRMRFSEELARAGVPVFISRGNHDSRTSWEDSIPYPPNVFEFGDVPETVAVDIPGGSFEVTGMSFGDPHETRNLAAMLSGNPDVFTIACLHCDVDACSEGYPYAPCRMSDLVGKGIDYWALGHIHRRQVLSESPYVVYPGNIQGRSIKETGEKGAYLVTVEDGRVSEARFVPTQGYVWKEVRADITGMDLPTLMSGFSFGRGDIVRLNFTGTGELDRMLRTQMKDLLRMVSTNTGAVLLEPTVETSGVSSEGNAGMASVLGAKAEVLKSRGREGIIDAICGQRMASRHRDFYERMTDEELTSMVDEAVAGVLASRRV